ncbi:MAG: hypothetical protein ABSE40_11080 [Candidatus Sulfotelmatobacter sp.]
MFNCASEDSFHVGDVLELVPFTNEEKTEYFNRFGGLHHPNFNLHDFGTAKSKLSGYFFQDSTEGPHFGTMIFEARTVITAMRLMKKGMVGALTVHYHADCPPLRTPSGGTVLGDFRLPQFVQDPYLVTKEDVVPLISLANTLRQNLSSKLKNLNVALNRFNLSYSRGNPNDRLLDQTIALESCLLAGGAPTEEITYKFSLRGSAILSHLKDPVDANAFLRYVYRLRSAIVHEGKSIFDDDKKLAPPKIGGKSLDRGKVTEVCEDYTRLIVKEYVARLLAGDPIEKVNADLDSQVVSALRFVGKVPDRAN